MSHSLTSYDDTMPERTFSLFKHMKYKNYLEVMMKFPPALVRGYPVDVLEVLELKIVMQLKSPRSRERP